MNKTLYNWKDYLLFRLRKKIKSDLFKNPLEYVLDAFQDEGFDTTRLTALDVFARNGLWLTKYVESRFKYLEMWELDKTYAKYAARLFPNAIVVCGDSLDAAKNKKFKKHSYQLIIIDNSVGFQFNDFSFESLGILPHLLTLLENESIIFFNVATDVTRFTTLDPKTLYLWQEQRNLFYGLNNSDKLIPSFLESFYQKYFKKNKFEVIRNVYLNRNESVGSMGFWLKRID